MVRGVLLVLAALAVALVAAGTASAQNELVATVGSASITVTHAAGGQVSRLEPGTYTITVRDQSAEQNFHLSGPGVNIATDIEFVGTETFTVTLREGTYTFTSDADAYLGGTFRVGTAATTTSPPPPAGPKTLVATVGPGFTINLTRGGRRVTRLKAGTYTVVVRDRASIHNFRLRGPGRVNRATSVAFVGSRTWRVRLVPGVYRYRCDPHASHLARTFRVIR